MDPGVRCWLDEGESNMNTMKSAVLGLALVLAVAPARAQVSSEKVGAAQQAFRDSVVTIRDQIGSTLASLDEIVKGKDAAARKNALKKYSGERKAMEKQIDKTNELAAKMKAEGQAYFKDWDKSMKSVKNETIQASATERRQTVETRYKMIEEGIAKAKESGPTFRKNLSDLQDDFAGSVSDEAIATSGKLVESASADGKKIQGYLNDVVAAVDSKGETAAAPAAAAKTETPAAAAPAAAAAEPAKTEPAAEAKPAEAKPEQPAEAKPEETPKPEEAPKPEEKPKPEAETPPPPPPPGALTASHETA